ncbi:substrate-binding domain-containing protein [Oceanobacillus oncorhynchi]|uniref:substrate-binding domain-containing protein n=1 Tax=Oceanobacillus oncorhynchi TaxID=545501 RepID=UPI0034D76AA0
MKKNYFLLVLWLGILLTITTACGTSESSGEEEGTFEVGFAMRTLDSPYYVTLAELVEEFGEEQGWNVEVLDANGDTTKEAENISTFISQGKDLIFVDAIEPDAVVSSINNAAEAGIPVINLDSGVGEDANDVTTVYSDNKQNGRLVGLAYGEHMGDDEIKAILLSGEKGSIGGWERRIGLYSGIIESRTDLSEDEAWDEALDFEDSVLSRGSATHEDANFTIVGQGWGAWTAEKGLTEAEDMVTANPDITTILGENDQMLFGAMTALSNAGMTDVDMVAGADGAKEAMDLIKEDEYFGTGLNSPFLVAEKGVEIAEEILVDGKDPDSYPDITLTEAVGITKENVDEYYDLGF